MVEKLSAEADVEVIPVKTRQATRESHCSGAQLKEEGFSIFGAIGSRLADLGLGRK